MITKFKHFVAEIQRHLWSGKYLYHFTLEYNLDEILDEGLIPRKYPNSHYPKGCQGIFLTPVNSYYRANLPKELEDQECVRLKVDVSNLDFNNFYPDDDYLMLFDDDKSLSTKDKVIKSLDSGCGVCYKGTIPPDNIVEHTKDYPM